jgi:hypothetical protein
MVRVPSRLYLRCIAAVIVVISGGSLLWSGPTDAVGSPKTALAEYRAEAKRLTLAPGWNWPTKPSWLSGSGIRGSRVGYASGYGTMQADFRWFCSWASQAASPKQSAHAQRRAFDQLARLPRTHYYQLLIPDERAIMDARIARAKVGRSSGLRFFVEMNCTR